MELRHLFHLETLAKTGSFHRAARQLGLRQPALSQSIRALEADIGVQLVVRTSSGSRLTRAGEAFLKEVEAVHNALDTAVLIAKATNEEEANFVRLGFVEDIIGDNIVRLLRKFIETTSCKFFVIDDSPEKLFKMLNGGMLDILLMPLESMGDYPFSEPLWKEDVHLALPSVHALAEEAAVDVRRLNGESLLLGSHDHEGGAALSLINACQAAGVKPVNHSVLLHWGVRLALVAAGIGIAVQPASRRCLLDTIGVVTRPLVSPLAMTIAAAWPEGGLTPFAFRFLELARTMNIVSK